MANRLYMKKYVQDQIKKDPNYFKRKSVKQRYNISLEEYDKYLLESKGKCKICKQDTKKLNLDHCHTTGKIRGVLCNMCNVAVGYYETWYLKHENNIKEYLND